MRVDPGDRSDPKCNFVNRQIAKILREKREYYNKMEKAQVTLENGGLNLQQTRLIQISFLLKKGVNKLRKLLVETIILSLNKGSIKRENNLCHFTIVKSALRQ